VADLDAKRLARQPFERGRVARGRPQLELGIARRPQLQEIVVAAVVQLEPRDRLRVTAVEALRQPQDRGKRADGAPAPPLQIGEAIVLPLRRGLTMIPRDEGDGLDLVRLETPEIAVLHQVVRVLVVPLVADVDADVVQDRRVLEPVALAIREAVDGARLVEERYGEARDLL